MTSGKAIKDINPMHHLGWLQQTLLPLLLLCASACVGQDEVTFPPSFRGTKENVITDPQCLDRVFQMIAAGEKNVRILQICASPIRGNILPQALGKTLLAEFGGEVLEGVDPLVAPPIDGGVTFDFIGINGARTTLFTEEEKVLQIVDWQPDLVIVSMGTNEAHGHFSTETHQRTLDKLVTLLRERLPQVDFLLTTPPGSYIRKAGSQWRDRRGRTHTNMTFGATLTTGEVARAIADYGHAHQIAVWNLYEIGGGDAFACTNWGNSGMMQTDRIHYKVEGYRLQGQLLGQAIIKAFDNFKNKNK